MTQSTKYKTQLQDLINNIGFDKDFSDLTNDQKADFLQLHNIPFLGDINREKVENMYNVDREIAEERGLDKLYLYI